MNWAATSALVDTHAEGDVSKSRFPPTQAICHEGHGFPIGVRGLLLLPAAPLLERCFAFLGEEQPLLNAIHVVMKCLSAVIQERACSRRHGTGVVGDWICHPRRHRIEKLTWNPHLFELML